MFKKLFLIGASAIAGIYITSEEGKSTRKALQKKKVAVEPIIKDLIQQANDVLAGTKELNSEEIKANVELLVNEAKDSLAKLDLDKAAETVKDAIRVASRQIRDASNEVEKEKRVEKRKPSQTKTQTVKVASQTKTQTVKVASQTKTQTIKKPVAKKTTAKTKK